MSSQGRRTVGIEKIWAYSGQTVLDLQDLARARDEDPKHPTDFLLMSKRTVNPCWEDPTTMAVNAAKPMLTPEDLASIELVIVGTESGPDQAKPLSTFVQHFLGVNENCRNFEVKHACYGATGALMMAAHWVASGAAGDAKALVIATDQSRTNFGERYEYLMGAASVALLISTKPVVAELELETCSYWTKEEGDTFRPTSTVEAGNTDASLYCYLEALDGTYEHFSKRNPHLDYVKDFKRHIYHVPFGEISHTGHRAVMKSQETRYRKADIERSFAETVEPGLVYTRQFAGLYGNSTFVELLGHIDSGGLEPGDRVSAFAYGSGSQGEMYSMRIGEGAKEWVASTQMQKRLDARFPLTVEQYEAFERERTSYIDKATYIPNRDVAPGLWERQYEGKSLLVLKGLEGYFRKYGWS